MDKLFGTLLVITPRHEISGDEEIKPHEECGVGREEMPDPRHKFCWIRRCISPTTTIAVCLTGMVHDHQDGQTYLQIIEII